MSTQLIPRGSMTKENPQRFLQRPLKLSVYARTINSLFMSKTLLKSIMKLKRFNFLIYRGKVNRRAFCAQVNLCFALVRKAKRTALITLTLKK